jgi:hypothetical protein
MSPTALALVLLGTLTLRLLFIAAQLSNIESLWVDYERGGLKFRLAQWLDWLSLGGFAIVTIFLLYKINNLADPLKTTFIGILGIQLLHRLKVSCFPRTNLPGAYAEAKIDLAVHLIMSLVVAAGITLLTAIYLWWQK